MLVSAIFFEIFILLVKLKKVYCNDVVYNIYSNSLKLVYIPIKIILIKIKVF